MNETNLLEGQLRSWTPRRPSRKLERTLFPRASRSRPFFLPRWATVCAPVLACVLLTLATMQPFGPRLLAPTEPQVAMVVLSLSNQHFAPYLTGNGQSPANRLDTFEWTNGGYYQSSMRSLTPKKATDLE